jgi:hypothetical protein
MQIAMPMRFASFFDYDNVIRVDQFLAGADPQFPSLPGRGPFFTELFFDALAPVANRACAAPANRWSGNRYAAEQDIAQLSMLVGDEWVSAVVFGNVRMVRRDFSPEGVQAPLLAAWYNATLAYHVETYARAEGLPYAFVSIKSRYGFEVGSALLLGEEPGLFPWYRHLQDVNAALRLAVV